MALLLDIPSKLQSKLSAEAGKLGLSLSEYVLRLLSSAATSTGLPRTGAELVEYWKKEGVIGKRREIADGPAHARAIRKAAERRARG